MNPLVYCNGDSYSDPEYRSDIMQGQTYADHLANHLQGYLINRSLQGSCNRRIVRTSLHDLIHQRYLNPEQRIIAVIGLSFEMRDELWFEDAVALDPVESNLRYHQWTHHSDWKQRLLEHKSINTKSFAHWHKWIEHWEKGRAFFYSPYQERINLLVDLVMLSSVLRDLDIDFVVFQGPVCEPLEAEYLKDFFQNQLDPRIMDLEKFGFCAWCQDRGFQHLDTEHDAKIGHYGPDAHRAFATDFLLPRFVSNSPDRT